MSILKPINDLALRGRKAALIIVAAATVISSLRVAFAAGYFYRG